jgi:hypothetical protein
MSNHPHNGHDKDAFEDRIRQMFAKIDADIEHIGFSMIGVGGSPTNPSFVYTIGLTQQGMPEIIMIGLPYQYAGQAFNDYYDSVRKGEPEKSGVVEELFNLPVYIGEIENLDLLDGYCGITKRWCESKGLTPRFTQWVWTDKAGKFPWDPAFDHHFDKYQPVLCKIPE